MSDDSYYGVGPVHARVSTPALSSVPAVNLTLSYNRIGESLLSAATCRSYDAYTSGICHQRNHEANMSATTMVFVLIIAATIIAVCSVVLATYRYLLEGKWVAGYWWSKRDREFGPGC